ncbi:hypothetical protein ONR57_16325 [Hoyosella sp. YIM 151337]|uniref:hypothetical protein n=1 Tax=Hoyosella sp. YIM 151337 TaxID=2992742 RepID=UPI002235956A|nr:hypothetical protein [Hoyosella sp. YIM 151337]MCW4354872.1 hypothetical protein [Hoyosella sp. YIM 151337]
MAFREVNVNEVKEVHRIWVTGPSGRGAGLRTIAVHCGVDRKTVRRYVGGRPGSRSDPLTSR